MLFAELSSAQTFGMLIGAAIAGTLCGLWPLKAAIQNDRPILGVVSFCVCLISGLLLGCLLALPAAIFFRFLIAVVGRPTPPPDEKIEVEPYNPYANGKRSAF